MFQFLIDLDDDDLREETIQRRLFDSNARDATLVVVAGVHSLAFTRAATSLAEALSGNYPTPAMLLCREPDGYGVVAW